MLQLISLLTNAIQTMFRCKDCNVNNCRWNVNMLPSMYLFTYYLILYNTFIQCVIVIVCIIIVKEENLLNNNIEITIHVIQESR